MQLPILEVLMQQLAACVAVQGTHRDMLDEAEALLNFSAVCRCRWRPALQARGLRLAAMASRRAAAGVRSMIELSCRELMRLHDFDDTIPFRENVRMFVRELAVKRFVIAQFSRQLRLLREVERMTSAAESVYPELETDAETDDSGER
jgi:hypothetical protein